jgi:chromosomal replication initiator protein
MNSETLVNEWNQVCEKVKTYDGVNASQVNAFFSRLEPQAMSEDFLMLTADTDFIKSWIERHYTDVIKRALKELHGVDFTVEVEVDPTQAARMEQARRAAAATAAPVAPQAASSSPATSGTLVGGTAQAVSPAATQASSGLQGATLAPSATPSPAPSTGNAAPIGSADMAKGAAFASVGAAGAGTFPQAADVQASSPTGIASASVIPAQRDVTAAAAMAGGGAPAGSSGLLAQQSGSACPVAGSASADTSRSSIDAPASTLTFENFVIGDSNRMAYSMAVAVAEDPGQPMLNPLFIYGKSGLGKTHLMRAIQNYIAETMPQLKTVYVDSADFLSKYMEATVAHDKDKSSYRTFKDQYENTDVLLIDDVQYLQGKKQTLDIVFQIFNKLTDEGKQVVLSADRAPKNIDIDERYYSRFNAGGTFDIQPPEVETKLGIIKSFIKEYNATTKGADYVIPDDIQMYIAENSSSNIRELKSAVTKVIYHMMAFGSDSITLDDVKRLLENHFSGGNMKKLSVADIQKQVEEYYKVSHADLIGKKRARNIVYARQVAIYLSRQMLDLPYNYIAKSFGNRDHTTIMYSVTNIEDKMKESRDLREELETIRQLIREM